MAGEPDKALPDLVNAIEKMAELKERIRELESKFGESGGHDALQ